MSESQERMMAVVAPEDEAVFYEICRKWDVEAATVGEVTGTGRLIIDWHGETIVDVDPKTVAHEGPVYERPLARPGWQDALQADGAESLPRPATGDELRATLLQLVASPNLCDKSWITDQYDRYVQGNTVLAQPADSGMLRVDEETHLGVALATDCNGRFAKLDPYAGAQLALAEAYRNVATGGAVPLAVSDCLNFGSPEDPAVMWQFAEACRGLKDACADLGIPVTGGNVSLYNQTGETAILPTPVVAVLGVVDDVRRRTPSSFQGAGEHIVLLGETREELSGSSWADVVHRHLGGLPPQVDLAAERNLARLLNDLVGVATSAHDLSDGGLAQALVEAALIGGVGARVSLDGDAFVGLFSESTARALVTVRAAELDELRARCERHDVPMTELGTTGGDALTVDGAFEIPLAELRRPGPRPCRRSSGPDRARSAQPGSTGGHLLRATIRAHSRRCGRSTAQPGCPRDRALRSHPPGDARYGAHRRIRAQPSRRPAVTLSFIFFLPPKSPYWLTSVSS